MERCILHVDMDAFFVSVELLRRPELRGQPVVVGGTGGRGVVAAASYEARRYGVHSAMPSSVARRLCPDAVFLPGDHERYSEVSRQVFEVFHEVTPIVEGISLDEGFLDVTGALRLWGDGVTTGHKIRARVQEVVQLPCSVGVAPNKFLAKLASQAAKPRARPGGVEPGVGVFEVHRGHELEFLHPLAVEALWGVGPATLDKLRRHGVVTVGDLAALGEDVLVGSLGRASGRHLHQLAQGIDHRDVEPNRGLKSVGHEETFTHDLHERAELWREIVRLSDGVAGRLRANGVAARTVTLKVRFSSFATITRSVTPSSPVSTGPAIAAALSPLLDAVDPAPGVRLVGVSGSNLCEPAEQLGLFVDETGPAPAWGSASAAIDDIRERFGVAAIGPASTIRSGKLRPVRGGEQQWGPDQER
jgi:DNA polymerase-4